MKHFVNQIPESEKTQIEQELDEYFEIASAVAKEFGLSPERECQLFTDLWFHRHSIESVKRGLVSEQAGLNSQVLAEALNAA